MGLPLSDQARIDPDDPEEPDVSQLHALHESSLIMFTVRALSQTVEHFSSIIVIYLPRPLRAR